MLTELDVVNACLASMGEAPLNDVDDEHSYVPGAKRALRVANIREQTKGWWFNRERVVLIPEPSTNFIYVPQDTISIDPVSQWTHLVQRGRRLYDPRGAGYQIGKNVQVTLLRLIPFEELPPTAACYIGPCAVADFQREYDADRMKVEQNAQEKRDAYITLRAEDIRNSGVNLLAKPSTLYKLNALGGRPMNLGIGGTYPSTSPAMPGDGEGEVDLPYVNFRNIFEDGIT